MTKGRGSDYFLLALYIKVRADVEKVLIQFRLEEGGGGDLCRVIAADCEKGGQLSILIRIDASVCLFGCERLILDMKCSLLCLVLCPSL